MDRDEALKLLRGGEEGIREWNQRRKGYERIPDLDRVDLRGTILEDANLCDLRLHGADISDAILWRANLTCADLSEANVQFSDLEGATLIGANFQRANLYQTGLCNATLHFSVFSEANLIGADLSRADLKGAIFSRAQLIRTNLRHSSLSDTDLSNADLTEADLSGANLTNANLDRATLVETRFVNARVADCSIYGVSAWGLAPEGAHFSNLYLSRRNPVLTVDDLEVAQFIYLLLNNEKIRNVINTISSKVVLILGSFTPGRKAVLDAIREELRSRDYCPVLFDFDKPDSRDFTETISTLAHMARFIIADITDAKSIAQELQAIVPTLAVPVKPLLEASSPEYGMFPDFSKYPWVLDIHRYDGIGGLLETLPNQVIAPAEAKAKELELR